MSSLIFIESGIPKPTNIRHLLRIPVKDLLFRVFISFVPPVNAYKRVYIDLQGPLVALFTLLALVTYGFLLKSFSLSLAPIKIILMFAIVMPNVCYLLGKLGGSRITLYESVCLVGYALYGHILTILTTFLFFRENSDFYYFLCLCVFTGLSTLRILMIYLKTIQLPIARLLICTLISIGNILFVIYLHFVFMHKYYVYKI